MQFTISLFGLVAAASTALGAPADTEAKLMTAVATSWTITDFTRTCNTADTTCHITFGVNRNDGSAVQKCTYDVTGTRASRVGYGNVGCGSYFVGSGWSNVFGDDNAFTVLSVTDRKQIVYPSYTDKQLVNGRVVKPDQSYAPQALL